MVLSVACHAGGRGFKSRLSRHNKINELGEYSVNKGPIWGLFCHKLPIRCNPQKSAIVFFVLKFLVANLWQILWRVFPLSNRAK